jgi:hypothetical protein
LVNIKRIPEYSPSGIYLGNRGSYNVDLKRLDNVIERIIRGLFYHHFGYRLPTSHIAKSFAADGLKDPNIWLEPNIRRSIEYVSQQPKNDIGGGIFSYKFKEIEDDPNSSVWLMMFFNSVFFVGFTFANKDS